MNGKTAYVNGSLLPNEFRTALGANGEMLALARESRGRTQTETAKALGIVQGTLSKMETGLLPLTDEVVASASTFLGYPPSFFQQSGPRIGASVAEIFHRKRADAPQRVLNRLYAEIDIRIRNVAQLLRAADIPLHLEPMSLEDYETPQRVAQLVRSMWNLPKGPIRDVVVMLEDAGIVVMPMDMGTPKIDAMARWVPGLPPVIFVNPATPTDRLRFSLCHELGHVLMHGLPDPEMERQADAFAAELLCPEREIRADLLNLTIDRLPDLKRYWRVSMAMLIYRARDVKAITESRAKSLWTQLAKLGFAKREPVELQPGGEKPELLFELIEVHREMKLTREEIAQMLHLTVDEIRAVFEPSPVSPSLRLMPKAASA